MSDNNTNSTQAKTIEENRAGFAILIAFVSTFFISVFGLLLDGQVRVLLVSSVFLVAITSSALFIELDKEGQFDEPEKKTAHFKPADELLKDVSISSRSPETDRGSLAPIVNFDDELIELKARFGGEFPSQVDSFVDSYGKFKDADPERRQTIASDMRASLSPAKVLVDEGSESEKIIDDIGERLVRYIKEPPLNFISILDVTMYSDGDEVRVSDLSEKKARIIVNLLNDGEKEKVELLLRFRSENGTVVRRDFCPVGYVQPNETKQLDTHVYVPSIAASLDVSATKTHPEEAVLEE